MDGSLQLYLPDGGGEVLRSGLVAESFSKVSLLAGVWHTIIKVYLLLLPYLFT